MNRWITTVGISMMAGFAFSQVDGIEVGNYNMLAGAASNTTAQTGPNRWHYLQQPFNDSGVWQNASLSAPFGTITATRTTWKLQSNGTGPESDNQTSGQVQLFNLSFKPVAEFSITAHSLTTSMSLSQTNGAVQGTRTVVVKNMTIKAFGHVMRFDGPIAANTVLWSGDGVEVIGNRQALDQGPVDVDMSVSGLYITFSGIDLGHGNNQGQAIFTGVTAHLLSMPGG